MKAAARQFEVNAKEEVAAPDGSSLYFKNLGLFSDPYLRELSNFQDSKWMTTDEIQATFADLKGRWDEWREQFENFDEAQLEEDWIRPVFKALGFSYQVQERLKKYGRDEIPDYSLFENDKIRKKAQNCADDDSYFEHTIGVADAKAMSVNLDGSKLNKTNPSYQIAWYLTITKKDWGILTNGRYWRLYSPRAKSRYSSYYEINIEKCFAECNIEAFKYFFFFFRKEAFLKSQVTGQCFLDIVFEGGEHYATQVETKLKDRAFEIAEAISQGFFANKPDRSESSLSEIYKYSLYFLFRLMFILNCEAKGLLSVHKQEAYYKYSLRKICRDIKDERASNTKWAMLDNTYKQLMTLFKLLSDGDSSIGIHGFGSHVFGAESSTFFKNNAISDLHLNNILLSLAYTTDECNEINLIDYKRLSADHLGSVFEGLLEYKLGFEGAKKEPVLLNAEGIRKKSGSYYTPNHIVDYIVKKTLDPITEKKNASELFGISVLDPAMGSAHFLLGAIQHLEEKILEAQSLGRVENLDPTTVRWQVLHHCIYGVDLNPLAIELGKFSLWMYSAKQGLKLEPLDDQIKCGNSLIEPSFFSPDPNHEISAANALLLPFNFRNEFANIFEKGGFSAVVTNPPFVFSRSGKIEALEKHIYSENYKLQLDKLNTYGLFIERSFSLVQKEYGRVGMICPNTWMSISTMKSLRDHLLSNAGNLEIVNVEYRVFPDADVDTSIVIFDNSRPSKVRLSRSPSKNVYVETAILDYNELLRGTSINVFDRSSHWPSIEKKILDQTIPLASLAKVCCGIQAYEVGKGTPTQTEAMKENRVYHSSEMVDSDYIKYICGSDVCRYVLGWSGEYIKYGNNLGQPRKIELFEGTRILVRQIPTKPPYCISAALASCLVINDKNVHIVIPKSGVDANFLLGIINSKIISYWFFATFGKMQKKTFPQFKIGELEMFPIPRPSNEEPFQMFQKAVSEVVIEIQELVKQKNIEKATALSAELDNLIADYFNLTEEQRKWLENWTSLKSEKSIQETSVRKRSA